MMRKVHAAALADLLKSRMPGLEPPFRVVSGPQAKVLETQRRMSFCSAFSHGIAYVLFQPAATAVDDYFTVDLAWLRSDQHIDDEAVANCLAVPLLAPRGITTLDEVVSRPCFRVRLDDVWAHAPPGYGGGFRFSTAASRYCDAMFSLSTIPAVEREARSFELLQAVMLEEKLVTPEHALAEVSSAAGHCLDLLKQFAMPFFLRAEQTAAEALSQP